MTKYINDLENELKSRKKGILKNSALWSNMPVSDASIDGIIEELETKNAEIDNAIAVVQQLRAQARISVTYNQKVLDQIDNLAYGLHSNDVSKLSDYGIAPRKALTPKAIPAKGMIKSIVDDYDGEGFILERDVLAGADNYEWQRAVGTDATVTNIDQSKFAHYKITKKKTFVDDYVNKGIRYFYRFRGFNAAGNGPWSEPVSRVQ